MEPIPVVDLHEDISTYFIVHGGGVPLGSFDEDISNRDADIPKYRRAGVKIVFGAMFSGLETFKPSISERLRRLYNVWLPAIGFRSPQSLLLEHFSIYYRLVDEYKVFKIIENYSDVEEVLSNKDMIGIVLHIEGADCIDDPYDLKLLRKLGLRGLGLTWNYGNKYAAACNSRKDYGLTDAGEELVRMANKYGIIIDLAHASKNTIIDVTGVSKKPVIVSHTNVRRIVNSHRNIDDESLEAIYKNKGVVGISAIGPLVAPPESKPSIDDLVKHYLYIYESYSVDMLAIGTDFLGLLELPRIEGFRTVDDIPRLLARLRDAGLGDEDLEKIAYKNALRVLKDNL